MTMAKGHHQERRGPREALQKHTSFDKSTSDKITRDTARQSYGYSLLFNTGMLVLQKNVHQLVSNQLQVYRK